MMTSIFSELWLSDYSNVSSNQTQEMAEASNNYATTLVQCMCLINNKQLIITWNI